MVFGWPKHGRSRVFIFRLYSIFYETPNGAKRSTVSGNLRSFYDIKKKQNFDSLHNNVYFFKKKSLAKVLFRYAKI